MSPPGWLEVWQASEWVRALPLLLPECQEALAAPPRRADACRVLRRYSRPATDALRGPTGPHGPGTQAAECLRHVLLSDDPGGCLPELAVLAVLTRP